MLSRDYLVQFHHNATADLQWYQIALQYQQDLNHQSNITIENLQRQLAQSQGSLQRSMVSLEVEKQRSETYKRVCEDYRGLAKQLQKEIDKRKDIEAVYEELQGDTSDETSPTPTT
jgi:hypothetical protein